MRRSSIDIDIHNSKVFSSDFFFLNPLKKCANLPAFFSFSICSGFSISSLFFRSSSSSVVTSFRNCFSQNLECMGGKGAGPFKLSSLKLNIFKYYLNIDRRNGYIRSKFECDSQMVFVKKLSNVNFFRNKMYLRC